MKSNSDPSTLQESDIPPKLQEWFDYYEKHTGSKPRLSPDDHFVWDEKKGFLSLVPVPAENALLIHYMCGDGKYWERVATELADALGYDRFFFSTRRNPKAFERRFGAKLRSYLLERKVHP